MSNVIHIFTGSQVDPETGVLPHPGECLGWFHPPDGARRRVQQRARLG